jgi:hypothetical protein
MADTTIKLGDVTVTLLPPKGLKAVKMMPKVISVLGEVLYTAIEAGIPLDKMFIDGTPLSFSSQDGLRAVKFVSEAVLQRWDELSFEIIPFLMCTTKEVLDEAAPNEILGGLWASLKYHMPFFLGEGVFDTLKNSLIVSKPETPGAETTLP